MMPLRKGVGITVVQWLCLQVVKNVKVVRDATCAMCMCACVCWEVWGEVGYARDFSSHMASF
eukprot:c12253_g1_i3 orf=112-297(-)